MNTPYSDRSDDEIRQRLNNAKEYHRVFEADVLEEILNLRAKIARSKEELEFHAWEISPAMAQGQIDNLNAQLAEAKAVNQILWANLTPDQRHLLNLKFGEVKP